MEILKLRVSLFEVPLAPATGYVDLIEEGIALQVADFDLGNRYLDGSGSTLRVE